MFLVKTLPIELADTLQLLITLSTSAKNALDSFLELRKNMKEEKRWLELHDKISQIQKSLRAVHDAAWSLEAYTRLETSAQVLSRSGDKLCEAVNLYTAKMPEIGWPTLDQCFNSLSKDYHQDLQHCLDTNPPLDNNDINAIQNYLRQILGAISSVKADLANRNLIRLSDDARTVADQADGLLGLIKQRTKSINDALRRTGGFSNE